MDRNWTIPNLLTIARILLTPGFVMAFLAQRFDIAWGLFAVAGLTDALDGFLARVLHQRSLLGSILDPLADKVLLVTSFICLTQGGWLPGWICVLVVSRDIIIVGGLAVLHFWGVNVRDRIHPSKISKATTGFQVLLVFFVMIQKTFDWDFPGWQTAILVVTAALTLASGAHYVLRGVGLFSENGEPHYAKKNPGENSPGSSD